MLLNSCRRESVGKTVGRTAAAVLFSQMKMSLPSPQATAAITGSTEKGPAQRLALGTVPRADDPAA